MTAFVVLHYLAADSTRTCVDRIKALDGEKHIIIVDNASPDGSGLKLAEEYSDDLGVTVLLNWENSGFAVGNNLGIQYAILNYDPDFAVVLNDDVELMQRDFCSRIEQIYNEHPFDLLGPDITSGFSGIHQSPKRMDSITLEGVRAKTAYVRRSQNPLLMLLSSGEKSNVPHYRRLLQRRREKQGIDCTVPSENVVLHGSCVIFSRRFLDQKEEPFFSDTFMYYEMEILDWICRRDGFVSRYDPSIQAFHHQNVATRMCFQSMIAQSKFVCENLLESLRCAERLLLGACVSEKAEIEAI